MDLSRPHTLSASDAAQAIARGLISSVELVQACLAHIKDVEPAVQAWTFLDPDHALQQARAADQLRLSGASVGPLHGVPVGLKDIIDTAAMATENGSGLPPGRTASRESRVATVLTAAG